MLFLLLGLLFSQGCSEYNTSLQSNANSNSQNSSKIKANRKHQSKGPDLREDKRYAENDWRAYSAYDRRFNLDVLKKISRPRTRPIDTNVWVYTSTFAKRFAMPKRWIGGKDFKGALALAYRTHVFKHRVCGYGRNWDNCREVDDDCLLDVYLPHDSPTVPWNTSATYGRPYARGHSRHFLRPFHYIDDKQRKINVVSYTIENKQSEITSQSYQDLKSYRGESGIDDADTLFNIDEDGFGNQDGITSVVEFHRNALEGVDVITFQNVCRFARSGDSQAQIWLDEKYNDSEAHKKMVKYNRSILKKYNRKHGRHKNMITDYKIHPGASFMKRVQSYQNANKGSTFFEYFKKNISPKNQ